MTTARCHTKLGTASDPRRECLGRLSRPIIFVLCGLVLVAAVPVSATPSTSGSGVAPTVISLPSGPGSIEGLGDSFEPRLNSGTASYLWDVELPPGRGGFTPELALQYNSGNPNGMFGLGWRTNTPFIQRQTEKGLPHYTLWPDGDDIDNDSDGQLDGDDYEEFDTVIYSSKEELVPSADGYWRLENESEFVRFRKVGNGWIAIRRDGVELEFGRVYSNRVANAKGVFRWHLDRMTDPNGNVIVFEYEKLDNGAQTYPKRIVYNQSDSSAMEVRFKHELRPDVISDFRPRFELRTAYRCTEVAVLVGGEPVRTYKLSYAPTSAWQPLSLLASVTEVGRDGVSSLPPARFGYTGSERTEPLVRLLAQAPAVDLNNANIDLLDINADGLPDIIDTNEQPHTYFLNEGADETGEVLWTPSLLMGNPVGLYLGAPSVRFADMNGDGRTDLLHFYAQTVDYYSSTATATWQPEAPIRSARFRFDDPTVMLHDINHDKRIDVIQSAGQELFAWVNQGDGGWSGRYAWSLPDSRLQLDWPTTVLADMNGDRLLDMVHIAPGVLHYYPAVGFGEFGKRVAMVNAPMRVVNPSRLLIADVNGDGRGDVVYLGGSLDVWLNHGLDVRDHTRGVLAPRFSVTANFLDASAAFRQADVNGNGSTDIFLNTTLAGRAQLAFVDFSPGAPPNLLESVDNGIGGRTRIHYSSSVAEMVRDAAAGQPWSQTIPFPVPVVSAVEVDDGRNTYRTEFAYRDGYYDPEEKEFRGFAEVVKTDLGDGTIPNLVTSHSFHTGRNVEALKGKLLALETRNPDNKLFFREHHTWSTRTLPRGEGPVGEARDITYAFRSGRRLDVHEGTRSPVSVQWDYEYDDFGNLTRILEHGRLDPGWEDERVTEMTYTSSYPDGRDAWILDRVVQRSTLDPSGNRIAVQRSYYDGNAALGAVAAGNPTRVERWVGGTRWLDWERKDYDAYGNVTAMYDGEYRTRSEGHFREVSYDSEFTTYPMREVVHTGNPAAPLLEMRATYDHGFGKVTSHTDFNGNPTRYAYDTFGRLIAVVKPDDSAGEPTEAYEYVLNFDAGDGRRMSWVETRRREHAGGGTLDSRLFYDGLGRKIMARAEDEVPGRVVVTDTVQFNARRMPWRRYLPYSEIGTLDFKAPPFASAFMEHRYDALGRGTRITQPDGSFSTIEYEPFSRLLRDEEQTRAGSAHTGAARRFVVDGLKDGKGAGRLREMHEIVKLTDDGRQSSGPADWRTRYDYDLLDNLVLITDAQGNRKRAAFDGLSRKVFDGDPNRGSTTYAYDDASNLRETVDAKQQRITYEYDGANRLVAENYHDEGTPFSANRDPDVRYVYDRAGFEAELPDGRRATPRNTLGRLVSVFDLSGESHRSYDARGRVEWRVNGIRHPQTGAIVLHASAMDYDSLDRVTSLVYPDDDRITHSYNPRGLLETVARGSMSVLSNVDYASSGQLARVDHGNGVSTTYDYDDRLRLRRLTTAKPGRSPLLAYAYHLDGVSNIVDIDDLRPRAGALASAPQRVNDQSFEYDDLYRLTRVDYGFKVGDDPAGISYRYDRIGNLLEQTSNILHRERGRTVADPGHFEYQGGRSQRTGRAPGDLPGPHAATGTGSHRIAYDDNGNVVRLDDVELTWDFKDRLVEVKSDQLISEYVYDHANRRVTKHVKYSEGEAGILTKLFNLVRRITGYLWNSDSDNPAESVVQYVDQHYEIRDGAPVKYVYADQRRVARVTSTSASIAGSDTRKADFPSAVRYYHQDHLESTNVVTDAAGNLLEEIAYYPYGYPRQTHRQASIATDPYKFSQKEMDTESGLQYFEARYLDGSLSRFLSVDPALGRSLHWPFEDPQRLNGYSYALNRPFTYQDPSGEAPHLLLGGVSSIAMGFALAKATGSSYGWTDVAIDFGTGAIGVGIVGKLKALKALRQVEKFADSNNLVLKQSTKHVKSWHPKGDIKLTIRFTPSENVKEPLSQYARYTLRTKTGIPVRGKGGYKVSEYLNLETGMKELGENTLTSHSPLNRLADTPINLWRKYPDVPAGITKVGAGAAVLRKALSPSSAH